MSSWLLFTTFAFSRYTTKARVYPVKHFVLSSHADNDAVTHTLIFGHIVELFANPNKIAYSDLCVHNIKPWYWPVLPLAYIFFFSSAPPICRTCRPPTGPGGDVKA